MNLTQTAQLVLKNLKRRRRAGQLPSFLTVPGCIALMHDKMTRYGVTSDREEILELATDALYMCWLIVRGIKEEPVETEVEAGTTDVLLELPCMHCGRPPGEERSPRYGHLADVCVHCEQEWTDDQFLAWLQSVSSDTGVQGSTPDTGDSTDTEEEDA